MWLYIICGFVCSRGTWEGPFPWVVNFMGWWACSFGQGETPKPSWSAESQKEVVGSGLCGRPGRRFFFQSIQIPLAYKMRAYNRQLHTHFWPLDGIESCLIRLAIVNHKDLLLGVFKLSESELAWKGCKRSKWALQAISIGLPIVFNTEPKMVSLYTQAHESNLIVTCVFLGVCFQLQALPYIPLSHGRLHETVGVRCMYGYYLRSLPEPRYM